MNKIYRLVWNHSQQAWIPVSEISGGLARGGNKSTHSKLLVASLTLCTAVAQANPSGGVVTAGAGSIAQTANTTTIHQNSQNLSLNWQSFNIATNQIVNFVQPSASAIAVNRIFDTSATQILGQLNANGQVYLINPNGIVFGQGSQVNVGGLVASTLDVSDASLNSNTKTFSGTGPGSIVNKGSLVAANGGYIALLANQVSNQGIISAQLGSVALAGGSDITLTFADNSLVQVQVNQSTLNNLAENKQLVVAEGGQVFMSAGAKNSLLASVVNNTGIIEAQTVSSHNGVISLMGGMEAGTVTVGGIIDASAPNGGNGGSIETSAATVKVADNTLITTAAPTGNTGSWLVDPTDYTVAASGGDMTGTALTSSLANTNVTLQSSSGATGTAGNININDTVNWSANKLTLNAQNNININATMTATSTASLALNYGLGALAADNTSQIMTTNGASVNLPASTTNLTTTQGSNGVQKTYTVITALGNAADATTAPSTPSLQGIATADLLTNYALGNNIYASATSTWNSRLGFTPILYYQGSFNGLGHTINDLTINRPSTGNVGLFGINATGNISNIGLVGGSVTGLDNVGALVGFNQGTISNSYASSLVIGRYSTGGLVGSNESSGTISSSYATGAVTAIMNNAGGLVGNNAGSISNSYATGVVNGSLNVGALVGSNDSDTITNSYATGDVFGTSFVGGLVGYSNSISISNSYATGSVNGDFQSVGGLVGGINSGSISNSYATGSVNGVNQVGGLVGTSGNSVSISNSYATGSVNGTSYAIGGLVGYSINNSITNSFYNSSVNPLLTGIGLMIGGADTVSGLSSSAMTNSANFTGFNFTTTPGATGNNWVIVNADGSLNSSGTSGGGTTPMLASEYSTTINNAHQLQLMAMDLGASYTLGSNINAAATGNTSDVWANSTFIPVGNSSTPFTGSFNGLGHTISDLTINLPSTNYVGLFSTFGSFGNVSSTAGITNVGLVGDNVIGYDYVGGLVGFNFGTIGNSYATGVVAGHFATGGLIGANDGTISNSYATGLVTGYTRVGGLLGQNNSAISNSYATSVVTGNTEVGGLIGLNYGALTRYSFFFGAISNSYATGAVTGVSYLGGLVGKNYSGTISNSYATGAVTGTFYLGGLVGYSIASAVVNNSFWNTNTSGIGNSQGGTGMSTANMTNLANFTGSTIANGNVNPLWDFSTTWGMSSVINGGHPYLLSNIPPLPTMTTIYLDLISGSSVYGSAPTFSLWSGSGPTAGFYVYDTSATYGSVGSSIIDPSTLGLGGSIIWSSALTNTTNVTSSPYSISYSSGLTLGNSAYALAVGDAASWSVTPLALTGTLSAGSSVYGAALSAGAVTFNNVINNDTVSSAGTVTVNIAGHTSTSGNLTAGNHAGIESVSSALSGADAGNYSFAGLTGNYSVSQLALAGTIAAGSSVYGDALSAGAANFTNKVGSDALGTATVAVNTTGLLSTSSHLVAGNHTGVESVSALSGADAGNYSFAGLTGNYTVSQLALAGTLAAGSSVYGAALAPGAVSFSNALSTDLINTATVAVNSTSHTSTSGNLTAGYHTGIESVSSVLSGADAGNYSFAGLTGNYSVSQLALTVTANNQTRLYGGVNPTFTETISGFVNGENRSVISGSALASSAATEGTPVGTAVVSANAGNLSASNYIFNYLVDGALTIDAVPQANQSVATQLISTMTVTPAPTPPITSSTSPPLKVAYSPSSDPTQGGSVTFGLNIIDTGIKLPSTGNNND